VNHAHALIRIGKKRRRIKSAGAFPFYTLQVISAHEHRVQQERLAQYRQQHADDLARDAELMAREHFLSQRYRLADNQT